MGIQRKQRVDRCIFLVSILFFIAATTCQAGAVAVEATVNATQFPQNQAILLTITVNGANSARLEEPQGKGLQFFYQGKNSQMQWINGKASSSVSYVFKVQANEAGKHTIEPITVHVDKDTYTTKALHCEAIAASSFNAPPTGKTGGQAVPPPATRLRSAEADKVGFMRILTKKDTVYSGEILPFTIKALFRQGIRASIQSAPRLTDNNFILESLDHEPEQSEETINGVPYTVLTWNGSLSAVKQSSVPIEVEMDATLFLRAKRQRPSSFFGSPLFEDPFFDDFFSGFNRKDITLVSPRKNIEIRDLPMVGKSEDFTGAIGTFSLAVTAKPTKVSLGDPITLSMKVEGTGNFGRVQSPVLQTNEGWKTYTPSPGTQNTVQGITEKIFEQAIIPTKPGISKIPSVHFSYFDPQLNQYISLSSDPIAVEVEGTVEPVKQQPLTAKKTAPQQPLPTKDQGSSSLPAPIHLQFGEAVNGLYPLYQRTWFQLMTALCILLVFLSALLYLRRKKREADPRSTEKKRIAVVLNNLLLEAKKALEQHNSTLLLSLCRDIIQKRYGFTWQKEPLAICATDLEQQLGPNSLLADILRQSEHVTYTGERLSDQEMRQIFQTVRQDIEQLCG